MPCAGSSARHPLSTIPLESRTISSAVLHFPNDLAQSLLWILAHFLIGWCKSKLRPALTLKDPMWKCLLKMSNSQSLGIIWKVANVYSNKFKKNRNPRRTHAGSSARPSKGPELGSRILGPRETGQLPPEVSQSQSVTCACSHAKSFHHSWFQVTNTASLNPELRRDA